MNMHKSFILLILSAVILVGCDNDDDSSRIKAGPSVFIKYLQLNNIDISDIDYIEYTILPQPDATAIPIHVRFSAQSLLDRAYYNAVTRSVSLPIFGLYSDYLNQVELNISHHSGPSVQEIIEIQTAAFVDPSQIYDRILVNKAPVLSDPASIPSFSYFYIKTRLYAPLVLDIDGNVRWFNTGSSAFASIFMDNKFVTGTGSDIFHQNLDGTVESYTLSNAQIVDANFHHNFDPGPLGILVELDGIVDGVEKIESYMAEMTPEGEVLKEWDFGEIFTDYMLAFGETQEDIDNFVRDTFDWCHQNATTYDSADDSLIISCRENFIFKIDYETGALQWVLGDETKHWFVNYPSLQAIALELTSGNHPIGQHAVSITDDGNILLFNNGTMSTQNPEGTPSGINLPTSTPSKYRIDEANLMAEEMWYYESDIVSAFCSSVYQDRGGDMLISYSRAAGGDKAIVRIIDANNNEDSVGDETILLDIELMPNTGCDLSWNAIPLPFESIVYE